MQKLEPITSAVSLWMARIGGSALLGVAVLIVVEVFMRMFRIGNMSVGTELASYTLALAATWSLAYVIFERGHVRVDILARKLPDAPRSLLDVIALLSLAIVGAALFYGAYGMLSTSIRLGARSNTPLGIPLAIPQGLWTWGLAWFTLVAIGRSVQALRAVLRKDLNEAARIAASPSTDDDVEEAIAETASRLETSEQRS
ncbi:TRAP transporter small permease [Devosia sp. 2618]|uniref:TRAP transporter small permease subunit n=1 Tax=Devosia sp. 2618 TaxID=3156454 RepID=UPI0033963931